MLLLSADTQYPNITWHFLTSGKSLELQKKGVFSDSSVLLSLYFNDR